MLISAQPRSSDANAAALYNHSHEARRAGNTRITSPRQRGLDNRSLSDLLRGRRPAVATFAPNPQLHLRYLTQTAEAAPESSPASRPITRRRPGAGGLAPVRLLGVGLLVTAIGTSAGC